MRSIAWFAVAVLASVSIRAAGGIPFGGNLAIEYTSRHPDRGEGMRRISLRYAASDGRWAVTCKVAELPEFTFRTRTDSFSRHVSEWLTKAEKSGSCGPGEIAEYSIRSAARTTSVCRGSGGFDPVSGLFYRLREMCEAESDRVAAGGESK